MTHFQRNLSLSFAFGLAIASFSPGSQAAEAKKASKPAPSPSIQAAAGAKVLIKTNQGDIEVLLDSGKESKITVKNFLDYVAAKHYDGTIFHRVIPGFMIQGGGFDSAMKEKATKAPIKNEAGNGLKNLKGTIAMARTGIVDSATAQFFINVKDNAFLDHQSETQAGFGYAVFGKVTKGYEVVEKIEKVETTTQGMFENVPAKPVVIQSIREVK